MELKLKPDDGNLVNLNLSGKLDNALVLTLAPFYRGERGLPAGNTIEIPASGAIGGHRVVILEGDTAAYASNTTLSHHLKVFGITENAAASGSTLSVMRTGKMTEPSWSWTLDSPIFLGVDGSLTQTPPTHPTALFSLVVGFPLSATSLFVALREPVILGA